MPLFDPWRNIGETFFFLGWAVHGGSPHGHRSTGHEPKAPQKLNVNIIFEIYLGRFELV